MQFVDRIRRLLDDFLPDEQVKHDIAARLQEDLDPARIELETDRGLITFAWDAPLEIVTKVFFDERFDDVGFGIIRVEVAVGGIESAQHGIVRPKYCFATAYYNDQAEMIAMDIHEEFR